MKIRYIYRLLVLIIVALSIQFALRSATGESAAPTFFSVARTIVMCYPEDKALKNKEWHVRYFKDMQEDHDSTTGVRQPGSPPIAHNLMRTVHYQRNGALVTDDDGKVHSEVVFSHELKKGSDICRVYYLVSPR